MIDSIWRPVKSVSMDRLSATSGWTAGTATTGKIEELESLRGLAAIVVVFFHIPRWQPWLDIGLINNGYLMVELFFVLSGYVIYHAYDGRISSTRDLARFQFLRFGRLYPVHMVFLLGFLLLEVGKVFVANDVRISNPPFEKNSLTALLQQLLLVQAIGPTGNAYTFNTPAWSISTEFYTYLLFATIVLIVPRIRHTIFGVLTAGAFVMTLLLGNTEGAMIFLCLTGFFVGCLLCALLRRVPFTLPSWSFPVCLAGFVLYLSIKAPQEADWLIFPFSGILLVALLRSKPSRMTRWMRARVLLWLGEVSYSVYMSHSLVISLVLLLMKRGMGGNNLLSPSATIVVVAICVGLVLVVSHCCYRWLEVPLRDRSREIAARYFGTAH